jgi:lambda family phage portal protein
MTKSTWLDRFIGYFAPRAGVDRIRARAAMGILSGRGYDGATVGRRTDGWRTRGTSANAEIGPTAQRLRDRARDLVRNNPYAAGAVQSLVTNTIGAGILPKATGKKAAQNKKAMELWKKWGETKACDADGRHNIYGLMALAMRTIVESGEVIVRRRRRLLSDGLPIPMQIQVLEPDFLDRTKDGLMIRGGGKIMGGVEFDAIGRRVAYWLYKDHPGETRGFHSLESTRVPASEIEHIFKVDRPGQQNGVTWLASLILRLRDLDSYEQADLVRMITASCFTAFVSGGEAPEVGADGNPVESEYTKLEPGAIIELPEGREVTTANPPSVSGSEGFVRSHLRSAARGMGMPYEGFSGDYSNVNFSSAKMSRGEFNRNVDAWQWHMMIPGFCVPVWDWFTEAAVLAGELTERVTAEHTPPRRELVDPTRELPAMINAIRGGLMTPSGAVRELGYDPAEHYGEWAADAKMLDEKGLILDSDPRKVMKAGVVQPHVAENLKEGA